MKTQPLQWWECILIVFSIFIICMLFSLLLRKFNEVKLDNRLKALDNKRSWNDGEPAGKLRIRINPPTDNATPRQSEIMGAIFSCPSRREQQMATNQLTPSRGERPALSTQLTKTCCTVPMDNKDSNMINPPKPYLGVLYKGSNVAMSQSLHENTGESKSEDKEEVQRVHSNVYDKDSLSATLKSEHINLNKKFYAEAQKSSAIVNTVVEKVLSNMADVIQVPESNMVVLHEALTVSETAHKDHVLQQAIEPTLQEWLAALILANVCEP